MLRVYDLMLRIVAVLLLVVFCLTPASLYAREHKAAHPSHKVAKREVRSHHGRTSARRVAASKESPARHHVITRKVVEHRSRRSSRTTHPLVAERHEPYATGVAHPSDSDNAATVADADTPEPIEEKAAAPGVQPALYNRRGHLIVPPPLRGTHEILVHQNVMADRDGLDRIQDDADLERMRHLGLLVALPVNAGMQVDERLPYNRRYTRPWTQQFLIALARAHYARFHRPLQINSAVRTVDFQLHLIRINGNAAPAEGETASPHLTGQAVDIAKHGLSLTEIAWMRGYLLPLVQEGKIDVEEEFQQACFHISVYKRYVPSESSPRRSIAASHRHADAALAVAIH